MSEINTEPEADDDTRSVDRLLERLHLEPLDRDLLLGDPGPGQGRLFGGLVAAQTIMAAGQTVERGHLHSLHSYFLRPGRHDLPIRFVVDRIRDGRTFTTRRVVAHQGGEAIFSLSASFATPEEGIEHQEQPMPEVPGPEGLLDHEEARRRYGHPWHAQGGPIEMRMCNPDEFAPGPHSSTRRQVWMRLRGPIGDDPVLNAAVLAYASDRTLLSTAARLHAFEPGKRRGASLDHSMWFHGVQRFDGWVLYDAESPVAHSGRGLIFGAMYREDGTRILTVVQEGLLRRARD